MSSSSCTGTFPARGWDFVDRATPLRAENVLELNLVSSIDPQSPWHSEIASFYIVFTIHSHGRFPGKSAFVGLRGI
jgi:hypothetical protein